jgi:integral membrane protein
MLRFDTPTARLRAVACLEGVSYLVLLGAAMPLKYLAGLPLAVRIVGSLHGALFVWGGLLVLAALRTRHKSLGWALRILLAALLPFGTFFLDRGLREDDEAYRGEVDRGGRRTRRSAEEDQEGEAG